MANTDGKRREKKKQKRATEDESELAFDPGTALEVLHGAVVRIQALSEAAVSSLEFMPRASTVTKRRKISHICCLVEVLDEEIATAVEIGDEMVKRLAEFLKRQRS